MKKINFELSEDVIKLVGEAVGFIIYDGKDLEDAIKIILEG